MSRTRLKWFAGIIAVLLIANLISIISSWGLITIDVTDAPLRKVIRSIEWQGWITLYSDVDPETKVTMKVDHVPLAEAMESLCEAIGGQWHLGFFIAPNSGGVKSEINAFQAGNTGDDIKTYSFMTPLAMITSDTDLPVADPRGQAWPGVPDFVLHPPAPAATPAADPNAPPAFGMGMGPNPKAAPSGPPSTAQDYLRTFAQVTDVWIMAPASWDAPVATPPPASDSVLSAVKDFVSSQGGSVASAIILNSRQGRGPGGPGGGRGRGGFGGGANDWALTDARLHNAIGGLPADSRADALDALAQEENFFKGVQAAPPDQQRMMVMQHFIQKMAEGNSRRSPQAQARRFARAVQARLTATGQTAGNGAGGGSKSGAAAAGGHK